MLLFNGGDLVHRSGVVVRRNDPIALNWSIFKVGLVILPLSVGTLLVYGRGKKSRQSVFLGEGVERKLELGAAVPLLLLGGWLHANHS